MHEVLDSSRLTIDPDRTCSSMHLNGPGGTPPPSAPVLAPERGGTQRKGCARGVPGWRRESHGPGILALGESLCAPALALGTQRNGWVRLVRWVRGVCSAGGEGRARPGRSGSAGEAGMQGPVCGDTQTKRKNNFADDRTAEPIEKIGCATEPLNRCGIGKEGGT
jgi:hypothetical protein